MPSFLSSIRLSLVAAAALALTACSTMYPQPRVDMQPAPVVKMPEPIPASANNGAIYQNANYRPLFEDHRARLVGDIVTVQIVERVSATQKSSSELDKNVTEAGSFFLQGDHGAVSFRNLRVKELPKE